MHRSVVSFLLLYYCFFLCSCFKSDSGCGYQNDNTVAPLSEQQAVKAYLDSAGITATLDAAGFYYQILSPGAGNPPTVCSRVTVSYTGQLINGSVFDQQTDALFTLGGLIPGWKQGLPLISKGGEIKLYIPPALGYGSVQQNGTVVIPPNSILVFDIELIDVQ